MVHASDATEVALELFVARWSTRPELAGAAALALLSDEERDVSHRFLHSRDRLEHVVSRALARAVLAAKTGRSPSALRFGRGAHGRPVLEAPDAAVDFNLAHSDGLVACLVGPRGVLFGVDVERVARSRDLAVAEDFFAPSEAAAMRALPLAEQLDRFYALWTLKEAYIKARGLGLAIPLHTFHFELGGAAPTVRFEPELPRMSDGAADDATRWSFDLSLRGEHLVAIAARAAAPLRVSVHDVTAIGPGDVLAYGRVG